MKLPPFLLFLAACAAPVLAHDDHAHATSQPAPAAKLWPLMPEKKGPVRAPARLTDAVAVSGQGFWKFIAVTNAVPLPPEAQAVVKGAHGTLVFDAARDTVFWGLKGAGWIAYSNGLRAARVVAGDPVFRAHNLHGADLLPRRSGLPLVAAADNEGGAVYLTDTTFARSETLGPPPVGPYVTNRNFKPTDVAFLDAEHLFVTDGYGQAFFLPAQTAPASYTGEWFGGKGFSATPHGITFDARRGNLLVSARPEGQLKRWSVREERVLEIGALPPGTLLCDVDLWGDYALAACLEAPGKTPGPLMILNLKKRTIASVIKPKEELGYAFAQHMHDACWYFRKSGRRTEVYLVFTAWNPGGIGALQLVNVPD